MWRLDSEARDDVLGDLAGAGLVDLDLFSATVGMRI